MNPSKKINKLRKEIDKIDQDLIALLKNRFSIAKEIGQVKTSNSFGINDIAVSYTHLTLPTKRIV